MSVEFIDETNSSESEYPTRVQPKESSGLIAFICKLKFIRNQFQAKMALGIGSSFLIIASILIIGTSQVMEKKESAVERARSVNQSAFTQKQGFIVNEE